MNNILAHLQFSAAITGPICLMLGLGIWFKRINLINENFIEVASRIVFQVTLPTMLFLSIVSSKHDFSSSLSLVLYSLIANALFFIFTLFSVRKIIKKTNDCGVVTQGSFRANTAIIGLAYVANMYSSAGVALAAIYVAATSILFNIQAVIALTPRGESNGWQVGKLMVKTLTKNPLIISIALGLVCYLSGLPMPKMVTDAGHYFANMTLPLALLCAGGSLNLDALKQDSHSAWLATGYKLVLSPLLITGGAWMFGFRGLDLGLLFLMSCAPTSAASYVMARAMGGNALLAANIVALTTVVSLLTCTLGIFLLTSFGMI
ncbi:AEC family transporter (plasmid) [Vibrio sp. HDW18]|uniref:AEC family transporter n=1 Tax=Vibrio sp. HDW18 TaxID=2714948 RepID=UPI00140BA54C|nr:AEC family transporter [Vibrio sp. HDW18]QIL86773.1 AEC family transporter [Vibrio sp. HDW18]